MILAQLDRLDRALFRVLFRDHYLQGLSQSIRLFSRSGDGILYVLFALYAVVLTQGEYTQVALVLLVAYLIERPVYFAAKNLFQRVRPCDLDNAFAHIQPSDKFSLPSGHSAGAWVFATTVGHFFPEFAAVLYVWASGVALSRVLLGVHYPLDVVLGSTLGYGCALMALLMTGTL